MAFCVNCGNEVSSEAVMCPRCGHPGPNAGLARATVAGQRLASWGVRAGAALVDFVLFAAVAAALAFWLVVPRFEHITVLDDGTLVGATPEDYRMFAVVGVTLFVAIALYRLLMEGRDGQTLGKKAAGIRVVRADDGEQISYGKAFFRWFISWIINIVPFGGFVDILWPLWDDKKQTLHDKAASTVVVKM